MSPEKRSVLMSRIKGKDTGPERFVEKYLRKKKIKFKKHLASLPGKPDFVLLDQKIAIFIDGDFWHGWRFSTWKHKLKNWWRNKILDTQKRDIRNFRKLRRKGWIVYRIWEHQLKKGNVKSLERMSLKA